VRHTPVSPAPRGAWEAALASYPNALVSQTPAWSDFLCAAAGYDDVSRMYELPGDRHLVLPMVRRKRLVRALTPAASMPPAWGIGGLVAPDGVRAADAATVFADLEAHGGLRALLRPNPLDAPAWASARPDGVLATPHRSHLLELDSDFERVLAERFTSKARRDLHRAQRSGLTVECDTSGRLVPVYYELFERSLARWAGQQHEPRALARWRAHRWDPRRKFELMAQMLEGVFRLWVAWADGLPAAAILILQGTNAAYTRGAMDKEIAGPTRANYLLHARAIEEACASGCRWYDMGDSGGSASLARFKQAFGARPRDHADYHVERLPFTALERRARQAVKRAIRFREEPVEAA
jgi:GNAT acetyltransferase-like protein